MVDALNVADAATGLQDASPDEVIKALQACLPELSPRMRSAARHLLDHPNDIAISSMRQLAHAAKVPPNTLVRLARALGFPGYEGFRHPFREATRRGADSIPDRARSLQQVSRTGQHGELFRELAESAVSNVATIFSTTSATNLKRAARMMVKARTTYVLGMGACHSAMQGFHYVGRMALANMVFTPQPASLPRDDLARIGRGDVLFAATYRPYRREVVDAARFAKSRGAKLISLTDSRASPIAIDADQLLLAPTASPQFFPSILAMTAMLESVLAFIVAETDNRAVDDIEAIHRDRTAAGVYWPED